MNLSNPSHPSRLRVSHSENPGYLAPPEIDNRLVKSVLSCGVAKYGTSAAGFGGIAPLFAARKASIAFSTAGLSFS